VRATRPITLTFSVTGMCQSRCKTCKIGEHFQKNPKKIRNLDLKINEIENFFESLGYTFFFNLSGGEPYLRNDLAEIIELSMIKLKPKIIHIPTNAFLPEKIEKVTKDILEIIKKYDSSVPLTIKPSVDGIGDKHDEIRGLKGNFERLKETIHKLKYLEKNYPNFHIELGTVISNFNIDDLDEIEEWVHKQGVQSYRNEIAEQREEFFNMDNHITPSEQVYEKLMIKFKKNIAENLSKKKSLAKLTESIRLVYYDLVVKILGEKKQVIPCYAGISNIHLNYNGEIWPCCVLGYSKPMGNIRDHKYDFNVLINSQKAKKVIEYIKGKNCYCPLANQAYSNILMNWSFLLKVIKNYIKFNL